MIAGGAMPGGKEGATPFSYHRGIAPMLWALLGLSIVELGVVHLLVALLWDVTAALVLSFVTIAGIAWLIRLLVMMPKRPVLLGRDGLVMQVGTYRCVRLALASVASVRADVDPMVARDRSVMNMALLAHPNVVIHLSEPLPGRRPVRAIAHRLDDPDTFVRTFEALRSTP